MHRDPPAVRAHLGDELIEQCPVDVGRSRGPFDRESAERGAQRGDLRRVAVVTELAFVGAVVEQRVRHRREHRDIGTGADRYVHVGAGRGLGPARIEHPNPPAACAVLAQMANRIRQRGAVAV